MAYLISDAGCKRERNGWAAKSDLEDELRHGGRILKLEYLENRNVFATRGKRATPLEDSELEKEKGRSGLNQRLSDNALVLELDSRLRPCSAQRSLADFVDDFSGLCFRYRSSRWFKVGSCFIVQKIELGQAASHTRRMRTTTFLHVEKASHENRIYEAHYIFIFFFIRS